MSRTGRRLVRFARAALAVAASLALPAAAHACAVCTNMNSEQNRKAFFDTTVFLSLLPLGLIAGGLVWLARKGRSSVRDEFRESDEDVAAPSPESSQGH